MYQTYRTQQTSTVVDEEGQAHRVTLDVADNAARIAGPYVVTFVNVDGAGRYDERHETLREACDFAYAQQQQSAAWGDPWSYRYKVRSNRNGTVVARTTCTRIRPATADDVGIGGTIPGGPADRLRQKIMGMI